MLTCFVSVKLVPELRTKLDVYGLFYLYSACSIVLAILCYFIMPETTGLSLEEIEDMYRSKNKAKNVS